MPTIAEIISIGDELLYGQTLDTNAHWISGQLDLIGIKVKRRITIGDVEDEILTALSKSIAFCLAVNLSTFEWILIFSTI